MTAADGVVTRARVTELADVAHRAYAKARSDGVDVFQAVVEAILAKLNLTVGPILPDGPFTAEITWPAIGTERVAAVASTEDGYIGGINYATPKGCGKIAPWDMDRVRVVE